MPSKKLDGIFLLALLYQPDIEFHRPVDAIQTDLFVVAVDRLAFLRVQIHSGEAVNVIGNAAVVTGVGALYH